MSKFLLTTQPTPDGPLRISSKQCWEGLSLVEEAIRLVTAPWAASTKRGLDLELLHQFLVQTQELSNSFLLQLAVHHRQEVAAHQAAVQKNIDMNMMGKFFLLGAREGKCRKLRLELQTEYRALVELQGVCDRALSSPATLADLRLRYMVMRQSLMIKADAWRVAEAEASAERKVLGPSPGGCEWPCSVTIGPPSLEVKVSSDDRQSYASA